MDLGKWLRAPSALERLSRYGMRPDLTTAAADMVSDPRSDRAVFDLDGRLRPTETVLAVAEGKHQRRLGLLVLTSERVLFSPGPGRPMTMDVPLSDIVEVRTRTTSAAGDVALTTGTGPQRVDKLLGLENERFATAVRAQLSDAPAPEPPVDPLIRLAELRDLRDRGTISDAEFDAEKARLIKDL